MKIGILGGSFDPIHLGHVNLALDAKKAVGLDKVIFIPAAKQPFKLDKKPASGQDRLEMIKLAVEDIEGLEVSSYELDEEGISYTYLTVRAMRRLYGDDAELYFITGTDTFLKIEIWKNAEELLTGLSYIIGTRPGYKQQEFDECADRIYEKYGTEILNINNTQYDISSTEIRERVAKGLTCHDLIPEKVERYIIENGLYK